MANVLNSLKNRINNQVVKAGSWYTLSNFFTNGISFLTIPIFTRILTTEDYGLASLYFAWLSIFTSIIGLGLNESIRRAKFEIKDEFEEFVSSITVLSSLIFLFFLVMSILNVNFMVSTTGMTKMLVYFLMFHSFFSYIQRLAMTKFQLKYQYKKVSILNITLSIIGVPSSIYLILYVFDNSRYLGKIIGTGLVAILLGIYFLFHLLQRTKKNINLKWWKFALVLGIPLVFHSLGMIANNQLDRIIINKFIGAAETGIYSFSYQLGMIVHVVFISIEQAWNPWFFERFNEGNHKQIQKRAINVRSVFSLLYISVLMCAPEIVMLMVDSKYWEGLHIIPWIFMANYFVFMYSFEVNVEYAMKKTNMIALGTIISAIVNLILNIIFIPIYGYIAAAITTVISCFLLFLFHYLITSKVLKHIEYGLVFHIKSILIVTIATIYYVLFIDFLTLRIIGMIFSWVIFYLFGMGKFNKLK